MEINGLVYILFFIELFICFVVSLFVCWKYFILMNLQWDVMRQKVYVVFIDIFQVFEGVNDFSEFEIFLIIELMDVNYVWVILRLFGSEDVVSLWISM